MRMIIVIILCCILLIYIWILHSQIHHMNEILNERLEKDTRQIIHLQLMNKDLNQLATSVNRCLKAEELLRLKVVEEEENFKQMIANISHDLRTPLTVIKGYLQLVVKEEQDEKQKERLQIVRKHSDELGELIEHFFEYTYLLDSKPEVQYESIGLGKLVIEEVVSMVPVLEEKNLKVEVEEKNPIIWADREMTKRITQNLIKNCAIHAKDTIRIRYSEGETCTLHVINGVGEELLDPERLFDRFYVGNHARKSTGLGLAIVRLLAEAMGGSVMASMQEGMLDIGVTFNKPPHVIGSASSSTLKHKSS